MTPVIVTDRGLASLSKLEQLRQLVLVGTAKLTESGFGSLGRLRRLAYLDVPASDVTDEMIAQLAPLTGLQSLTLDGSKITGKGLASLKGLWRLKTLALDRSPFDDAGSANLVNFPLLETLRLDETKITDLALANIGKLSRLHDLWIDTTVVTDNGLDELRDLKKLRTLQVVGTEITDDGKEKIEQAIPGLHVPREGDMVATGWYASFPAYDEDADVMADDETGGAGAKEPPQKSLSLPGRGQGEGPAEAVSPDDGVARPTIIVARHVILWDRKIVSWEQMVLRFRTMRADGPIHPQFKFTNGAIQTAPSSAGSSASSKNFIRSCSSRPA